LLNLFETRRVQRPIETYATLFRVTPSNRAKQPGFSEVDQQSLTGAWEVTPAQPRATLAEVRHQNGRRSIEAQRRSCEHDCLSDRPTSATTWVVSSLAEGLHNDTPAAPFVLAKRSACSVCQQWPQALLSQNETSLIREKDTLGAPSPVKVGGL
jgi:hypothetical protein